jgi:nucleotide-binding universal stress UspA family protein
MADHPVVAAFNATEEAADGLALAELLVRLTGSELLVARVLRDMVERPSPGRLAQLEVRRRVVDARRTVVAAIPDHADADIVPLLDPNLATALHELADAQDASYLVVGSSHLHGLGRRLLARLRVVAVGDVPGDLPHVGEPALEVERVRLAGDPGRALVGETANAGMLVVGSHGRGPGSARASGQRLGSCRARCAVSGRGLPARLTRIRNFHALTLGRGCGCEAVVTVGVSEAL